MQRAYEVTYQVFDLETNYCACTGADPNDYRYKSTIVYAENWKDARQKARAYLDSIASYDGYARLVSVR